MEHATLKDLRVESRYLICGSNDASAVDTFYNPILERAARYDRLSGFFSSHSLALAARGIAALINRGGKMRLICSPCLSPEDAKALENPDSAAALVFADSYFERDFRVEEDDVRREHVAAMAWMVKEKLLEIKLAVVTDDLGKVTTNALFHPKVGVVEDTEGNAISFSGSNNETASGWMGNQEEFKVFKAWEQGQQEFYNADRSTFDDYWEGRIKNVKCFDLPNAFYNKLIRYSESFSKEKYIRRFYEERKQSVKAWSRLSLFDYQKRAVAKWVDNDRRLMFEMATGSGKTRCAIGCLNKLIELEKSRPICAVIAVPTKDLCKQWEKELSGVIVESSKIICANSESSNADWMNELCQCYSSFAMHTWRVRILIVITTHKTSSSDTFVSVMEDMASTSSMMFIGDEVHGMGASVYQKGLLACYGSRLGLSATPERMFDYSGTECIRKFFGEEKFEFTIKDALSYDRVCPYNYYPIIVTLQEDEQERYDEISEKIRKLSGPASSNPDIEDRLKNLLIERSLIISAARNKIPALRDLISKNASKWKSHILAFACHQNFNECMCSFVDGGLITSPFTFKEDNRSEILKRFASGEIKSLLAMKCLDEGIDVPNAHVAILISSSTNPREYIQRIGRVIRKAPEKHLAYVYDFLVAPNGPADELITRDFDRAVYIAKYAQNAFDATEELFPKFK